MEKLEFDDLELIIEELTQKMREEIITANRMGFLKDVLDKYSYSKKQWYSDVRNSKVIVIGDTSNVKAKEIEGCIKALNLDIYRFEFINDYEKITNIDFSFLKDNYLYSEILVCAMPHKMGGIGDNASLISMIENDAEHYPTLIKITDESGYLKFSKTSFKKAIMQTSLYRSSINI